MFRSPLCLGAQRKGRDLLMNELKPGSVVVFKAGDNWVGKAIAWLTDSDVSHAAMMLENMAMVEMGASGIRVGPVEVLSLIHI